MGPNLTHSIGSPTRFLLPTTALHVQSQKWDRSNLANKWHFVFEFCAQVLKHLEHHNLMQNASFLSLSKMHNSLPNIGFATQNRLLWVHTHSLTLKTANCGCISHFICSVAHSGHCQWLASGGCAPMQFFWHFQCTWLHHVQDCKCFWFPQFVCVSLMQHWFLCLSCFFMFLLVSQGSVLCLCPPSNSHG